MESRSLRPFISLLLLAGFGLCVVSFASPQSAGGAHPVSVIVSAESEHGENISNVAREDVRVTSNRTRLEVTDWVACRGNQGGLELMVLIDELSRPNLSMHFDDLRHFFEAQPATTAIAVGYLENGSVRMAQKFTTDRSALAKALRVPIGLGAGQTSPFLGVTDALKHWPPSQNRRAIFLISSGFDPMQPGTQDTYLQEAITQAQKTRTQVSAIYAEGSSHFEHSLWRINQAQSNLSQLADETGGESYFQGTNTPIDFSPSLDQFANRLQHQYKLTFLPPALKKATYLHIQVQTEVPGIELVTADRVFVPAAK